ncbi:MAG: hypothetical protein MJZ90_01495 [Bacteroidales bacterium]|nr:hypothetical protein [Bacteroidales bacterium]
MKRFISMTLFMVALVLMPSFAEAQNDNTFNKQTLKESGSGSSVKEKRVDRKTQPEQPAEKSSVKHAEKQKTKPEAKKDDMVIVNPCSDWLDFEFVELVGNTSKQTLSMTYKVTNRDVNKSMYIGNDVLAYDDNGGEHKNTWGTRYDMITDVMISYTMDIPGQVLPSKVKKLTYVSFKIGDCKVEMRNVKIDWK